MREIELLKSAQKLIAEGQKEESLPLLWELYASRNTRIKLDTGMLLIAVLDQLTENDRLLGVVEETIQVASTLVSDGPKAYLLSKKAQFICNKISSLTCRQRSLNLAGSVFRWIDFSLEKDKNEFMKIQEERVRLEKEVISLESSALSLIQLSDNSLLRGHIFLTLGEINFSRYLNNQIDLAGLGKMRSKLMNIYCVRRWNLDKLIGYNRASRKNLLETQKRSIEFFERAIDEFKRGNYVAELAIAFYSLAVKYTVTYRFAKARACLKRSKELAKKGNDQALKAQIGHLENKIKDRYRHPRNYVEEFGLDLPLAVRKQCSR